MKEQPAKGYRYLNLSYMSAATSRLSTRSENSSVLSYTPIDAEVVYRQIQAETQRNSELKRQARPEFQRELQANRIRLALEVFEDQVRRLQKRYSDSYIYTQQINAQNVQRCYRQYELESQLRYAVQDYVYKYNRVESESNLALRNTLLLQLKELENRIYEIYQEQFALISEIDRNYMFYSEFALLQFQNKYHIFTLPTYYPPTSTMLNPIKANGYIIVPEGSKYVLLRALYKRPEQFTVYYIFNLRSCCLGNLIVFDFETTVKPLVEILKSKVPLKQTSSPFMLFREEIDCLEKQIGSNKFTELYMELPEFDIFFLEDHIRILGSQASQQKAYQADFLLIIQQLADALKSLHQEKLAYGRLCPQNVVMHNGMWKLIPPLHLSGSCENVLPLVVPEPYIANGQAKGLKGDIFYLGVLMFNLLMGSVDALYRLPAGAVVKTVMQQQVAGAGIVLFNVYAEVFDLLYSMVDVSDDSRPDAARVLKITEQLLRKELKRMK